MPTGGVIVADKYIIKDLYLLTTTLDSVINHLLNVSRLLINAKSEEVLPLNFGWGSDYNGAHIHGSKTCY